MCTLIWSANSGCLGKKKGVAFLSLYGVKPYDVETVTLSIKGNYYYYYYFKNHIYSNLPYIMHVTTKVHVILRRYIMLMWKHVLYSLMMLGTPCRLHIHLASTYLVGPSSVKRTWTGSAFSTNESV
jgi:hypothetical protein